MTRGRDALDIVWSGDREVAVWKPAGLSSERPASNGAPLESAISIARRQFGWPDAQLPHRLDRPTSGILVVAADGAVAAMHAEEQRAGLWTKWYLARIPAFGRSGAPASSLVGAVRAYIRRRGRLAEVVRSGGDPARHEVLAVAPSVDRPGHCHALLRLDTGRFHQIRVLCAAAGFPLVGDADYGSSDATRPMQLVAAGLRLARAAGTVRMFVGVDRIEGVGTDLPSRLVSALGSPADGKGEAPA
ncbi:MAG: hypothetical protein RIS86_1776 [Planctomycetota bacterium]